MSSTSDERPHSASATTHGVKANDPPPIGVVKVIIQSVDIVEDRIRPPRPCVQVRVRGKAETKATKLTEERTYTPNWLSESIYVLVYSREDILDFELLNCHRFRRNSVLGRASVPLDSVIEDGSRTNLQVSLSKDDSSSAIAGEVLCGLFYHPVLSDLPEKPTYDGILTLQLDHATGLRSETPSSYHIPTRLGNLSAVVSLGWTAPPLFIIPAAHFSDTFTAWNDRRQFVCFNRDATTLVVKLVDPDTHTTVHGHVSIPLDDLLFSDQESWPLSGSRGGKLGMSATWTSVDFSST